MSSSTFSIFSFRLQEVLEAIENNLNIFFPDSEYENMSFYHLVRMKKRLYGDSVDGKKKLQLFIDENKAKCLEDWNLFQGQVQEIEENYSNNA